MANYSLRDRIGLLRILWVKFCGSSATPICSGIVHDGFCTTEFRNCKRPKAPQSLKCLPFIGKLCQCQNRISAKIDMPLIALNSLDISMVKYIILFWVSIGEKRFSSMLSIINHVLYMLYFLHSYPIRLDYILSLIWAFPFSFQMYYTMCLSQEYGIHSFLNS